MFDYLTGIYNITPTPFKADGTLDEPSLRKLTEFTRGTGVNGMTILGVLGEADKLTERERERVTEIVIETAGDRFPICVGTTHAGHRRLHRLQPARAGAGREGGDGGAAEAGANQRRGARAALPGRRRGGRHPGGGAGFSAGGRRHHDERGVDREARGGLAAPGVPQARG